MAENKLYFILKGILLNLKLYDIFIMLRVITIRWQVAQSQWPCFISKYPPGSRKNAQHEVHTQ